jgi:Raf kinase inhibitor-like YbhB/YbcL family protein
MPSQLMKLSTDAINSNGIFDPRYTCDLDNSSPELRWENIPPGTAGYALIAEDRDAPQGIFTHWIIYNIPGDIHHLPAGIPPQELLPKGIRQGINSFGKLGYSGPCPPSGDRAHRYFFRLFALNQLPEIEHRVQREALLNVLKPYILATVDFVGLYQRVIQRAG